GSALLATAGTGNQGHRSFTVTSTDGSTQSSLRSVRDRSTPEKFPGELRSVTVSYCDLFNGGGDDGGSPPPRNAPQPSPSEDVEWPRVPLIDPEAPACVRRGLRGMFGCCYTS